MCEGHGHRRRHRRGFRRGRYPNADELLQKLEEYQKDLEQETADVADLIRRLKEGRPAETATV
jgi:ADP-dependent phosphofructokinase/glucokinase